MVFHFFTFSFIKFSFIKFPFIKFPFIKFPFIKILKSWFLKTKISFLTIFYINMPNYNLIIHYIWILVIKSFIYIFFLVKSLKIEKPLLFQIKYLKSSGFLIENFKVKNTDPGKIILNNSFEDNFFKVRSITIIIFDAKLTEKTKNGRRPFPPLI